MIQYGYELRFEHPNRGNSKWIHYLPVKGCSLVTEG